MKWATHIVSAMAVAALLNQPLVVAGSVLPDALERVLRLQHRHRAVHNLATGLLFTLLSAAFSSPLTWIAVGFVHHLILDITRHGVYIVDKRVTSPLSTDNPFHNALVTFIHLIPLLVVRSI